MAIWLGRQVSKKGYKINDIFGLVLEIKVFQKLETKKVFEI